MSLKIAKFINKHLKVYIQEYNYALKQQWLFLKYHDTLLVSKHPIKYFKKPTANHVLSAAQCDVLLISRKMAYSETRNGGTSENGIPEHQIGNGKTRIRNTKSRSTCMECQSHVNKSRLVDSSGFILCFFFTSKFNFLYF